MNWIVQVQYIELYLYFLYIDIAVILPNIFSNNLSNAKVSVCFVGRTTRLQYSIQFCIQALVALSVSITFLGTCKY